MAKHRRFAWNQVRHTSWVPPGRVGHTATVVGAGLFVFGGRENGRCTNAVARLELQAILAGDGSGKWALLEPGGKAPRPRCDHVAWGHGDTHLFIHGGEGGGDGERGHTAVGFAARAKAAPRVRRQCFDDLFCLNVHTAVWSLVVSGLAPLPRKLHSAVVVGGTVVVFGGAPSGARVPSNQLFVADAAKLASGRAVWKQPALAAARRDTGIAPAADGPERAAGDVPLDVCGRYGHSATATADGRMAVFGGVAEGGALLNDLHVYDLAAQAWDTPAASGVSPSPRQGHAAVLLGGGDGDADNQQLVVFGGVSVVPEGDDEDRTGRSYSKDLFVFNLGTAHWSEARVGHLYPSPRYGHAIAPIVPSSGAAGGGKFIMFGGLNSLYCNNDVWVLVPQGRFTDGPRAGTLEDLRDFGMGGGGDLSVGVERAIMDARKSKLTAESQLEEEVEKREAAEARARDFAEELEALKFRYAAVQEAHKEEVARVRLKLHDERARLQQTKEQLRQAQRLLCLTDLSTSLRLSLWRKQSESATVAATTSSHGGADLEAGNDGFGDAGAGDGEASGAMCGEEEPAEDALWALFDSIAPDDEGNISRRDLVEAVGRGGEVTDLVQGSVPLRPLLDDSVLTQMLLDGTPARDVPDRISWEMFCELTRDLRLQQRRRLREREQGGGENKSSSSSNVLHNNVNAAGTLLYS